MLKGCLWHHGTAIFDEGNQPKLCHGVQRARHIGCVLVNHISQGIHRVRLLVTHHFEQSHVFVRQNPSHRGDGGEPHIGFIGIACARTGGNSQRPRPSLLHLCNAFNGLISVRPNPSKCLLLWVPKHSHGMPHGLAQRDQCHPTYWQESRSFLSFLSLKSIDKVISEFRDLNWIESGDPSLLINE